MESYSKYSKSKERKQIKKQYNTMHVLTPIGLTIAEIYTGS